MVLRAIDSGPGTGPLSDDLLDTGAETGTAAFDELFRVVAERNAPD